MEVSSQFERWIDASVQNRSEKYSYWTDASLFPPGDNTRSEVTTSSLARDWQSLGVELVNFVGGKLAQELFPIDKAFFRLDVLQATQGLYSQDEMDTYDAKLGGIETRACNRLLWNGNYSRLLKMVRLLIVTGNALVVQDGDTYYTYSTRNYVVRRDGAGNPMYVILKERKAVAMLPEAVRKQIQAVQNPREEIPEIDFYTTWKWVLSKDGIMVERQQSCDTWKSDVTTIRADVAGVLPLYWDLVPGEHYGRGLVEAFSGDFAKYSSLSQALTLYEIGMCKEVIGVAPGSGTDIDALEQAPAGAYVLADPNSVSAIEFGNAQKAAQLSASLQELEIRMKRSFGFQSAARDSERTTAFEISLGAKESDIVFGGTYSQLSHNVQIPLAHLLLKSESPEEYGKLVSRRAKLELITGVPALGRAARVQALLRAAQAANAITQAIAPLSQKYSPERIIDMCLMSEGVDPATVSRTEKELAAQQAATAPLDPSDPQTVQQAMQGVM